MTAPATLACRRWGAAVLKTAPVTRSLARLPGRGAVVLRYHSVNDDPVWARECVQWSLVVPPRVFDAQVAFLKERHAIVTMDEIVTAMKAGRNPDRRWIAITFDDGYEDNYRHALPILTKHGVRATFYVTTGAVGDAAPLWTVDLRRAVMRARGPRLPISVAGGGPLDISTEEARELAVRDLTGRIKRSAAPRALALLEEIQRAADALGDTGTRVMMSWDEIRGMRAAGMTVGAHGVRHLNLPSLSDADLGSEVRGSKDALEGALDECVAHFAYPNGRTDCHCDARVASVVAAAGFVSASTSVRGPASSQYSPYGIPRLGVYRRHDDLGRLEADIQRARLAPRADRQIEEIARAMGAGGGGRP